MENQDYSVYLTVGGWFSKTVVIEAKDRSSAFELARSTNPFPANPFLGPSDEPIEIDIVNISEMTSSITELKPNQWRVRLLAHIHGCGTFLAKYPNEDEARDEGVNLFPGWPDDLAGWFFSSEDYVEVTEIKPLATSEDDVDDMTARHQTTYR